MWGLIVDALLYSGGWEIVPRNVFDGVGVGTGPMSPTRDIGAPGVCVGQARVLAASRLKAPRVKPSRMV